MTDTDRIDISQHINAICELLGLEPSFVGELVLTPTTATATVYLKNENGTKHLIEAQQLLPADDDNSDTFGFTLVPATETRTTETRTFEVRT